MKKPILLLVFLGLTANASERTERVRKEVERIQLSTEIARMVADDQAFRFGLMLAEKNGIPPAELMDDPSFKRKIGDVDGRTLKKIKPILAKIGWPKRSEYGEYTTNNVWLLVQHMDKDLPFQQEMLAQMESLLSTGEVTKRDYAYLYDRVASAQGKVQRYGTQGRCVNKNWEPMAMEKPEEVDQRRAEMGMESLDEYRRSFKDSCLH